MKASLQSTASEFVPGDQKPAGPVGGAKGSPSLTGTLSATPFVPSPKLLVGLEAPPFNPGLAPAQVQPGGGVSAAKQPPPGVPGGIGPGGRSGRGGPAPQPPPIVRAPSHPPKALAAHAAAAFAVLSAAGQGPFVPGGPGVAAGQRSPQASRGRGRRPAAPYAATLGQPATVPASALSITEALRAELQADLTAQQAQPDPGLPDFVGSYHSLCALEDASPGAAHPAPALGVPSRVYRAASARDGSCVALRRLDPQAVAPAPQLLAGFRAAQERWRAVEGQPFLAAWREALVSAELDGAPALWLAHAFVPGAVTLEAAHLAPGARPPGVDRLWQYLVQLAAALHAVHGAGLVLWGAGLAPSKILVSSEAGGAPRLRIAAAGTLDALMQVPGAGEEDLRRLQRSDLAALGHTLLTLACAGLGASPSLDLLPGSTPPDLVRVIAGLLASAQGGGFQDTSALAGALATHTLGALSSAAARGDAMRAELAKECENGRLLRLLARLGTVAGRPSLGGDTEWAETGDRYMLKLFYSFLLHQVDEAGQPTLDWGVLAESLNKLDAGVPESILLLSADEASMLVVTYADLKRCFERCQAELRGGAEAPARHALARVQA
ncbi:hypothetical protein ACKKBF_B09570 [Auxenochlorella protothecoides x Auxenochlorella symbiontica]